MSPRPLRTPHSAAPAGSGGTASFQLSTQGWRPLADQHRVGAGGVERIVEIELDETARENFNVSVDAVKELLEACKQIEPSLA